jgi:hypothetical protein
MTMERSLSRLQINGRTRTKWSLLSPAEAEEVEAAVEEEMEEEEMEEEEEEEEGRGGM